MVNLLEPKFERRIALCLSALLAYVQHDFTANVRNHWLKNYEYSRTLQADFTAEGNAFLCEARMAESGWFKDHAERGSLVRFLYVIEGNAGLS